MWLQNINAQKEKDHFKALGWLALGYFEVGLERKQRSQGMIYHVPLSGDTLLCTLKF